MYNNTENFGEDYIIAEFEVPEFIKHDRSRNWYIIAAVAALALLVYAYFTKNFLFAMIIIIGTLIMILRDGQDPSMIGVQINSDGVIVGNRFYDFDELKDFSIVYKPREDNKNLYFEFKNPIKPRLSFPLGDLNPLEMREELIKYLPEDYERENIPLSEGLTKKLKI